MSDILEDQKVHYIVKDYKRMYDGFNALVKENKELKDKIEKSNKRVAQLEKQLENQKKQTAAKKKVDGTTLNLLNSSLCQINSLYNKAVQFVEQTERLTNNIEELDIEIRKEL